MIKTVEPTELTHPTIKVDNFDPARPLTVVVDTSVFLHKLDQQIAMDHTDPAFQPLLKAQLVHLLSGCWLPQGWRDNMVSMVFACDQKDSQLKYWRHHYLATPANYLEVPRKKKAIEKLRLETLESGILEGMTNDEIMYDGIEKQIAAHVALKINYKDGRKLPNYRFTKIKELVYKWIDQLGYDRIWCVGYEADDMAAAICKSNGFYGEDHNIMLLTVDTDWLGLLDSRVTWCCMTGYSPRLRGSIPTVNAWAESRLKASISEYRDIWDIKGEQGDQSDSLPPSGGRLLPVIDLYNPPEAYRSHLTGYQLGRTNRQVFKHSPTAPDDRPARQYICSKGEIPVISSSYGV